MPDDRELLYPQSKQEEFAIEEIPQKQIATEHPKKESKWQWIGDHRRPEAQESKDGMSDLFKAVDQEAEDADIADAVEVDLDEDILDTDPDGSYDTLMEVSDEDLFGEPPPPPQRRQQPARYKLLRRREPPPMSMGGMRY